MLSIHDYYYYYYKRTNKTLKIIQKKVSTIMLRMGRCWLVKERRMAEIIDKCL